MATPCGHSFCGFCVQTFMAAPGQLTCQECRQPVTAFVTSLFVNNILASKEGECRWCQEKIRLDGAITHVSRCEKLEEPCQRCKRAVARSDKVKHAEECCMREVVCVCGTRVVKYEEQTHKATTCVHRPVPCPLKCGEDVKW